jgi:tRNA(Ile)-lysidine synthase
MSGSRLVSDYLTDQKCTLFEKRRQLVVIDATGQIVWLVGQRTAQPFCVTPDTSQVLVMEIITQNTQL